MKAVYIEQFGGAENLAIRELPDPPPPTGREVLVKVAAAALNRADILQRKGLYPAPEGFPERVPGLEFAGEVVAAGDGVSFEPGARVFGITAGGAQAAYLLSDAALLARVPANLSLTEAAAIPEAFITAHDALFTQAGLRAGETLLVHAVGSGVGLAALQLAKARGARVFGTSRTPEKLERCGRFGLDGALATDRDAAFADALRAADEGRGADVVLDLVGAKFFAENLKVLNSKGRLVLVGLVGGARAEFELGVALAKRLHIVGTVLRSRPTAEKAAATARFVEEVGPLLENGRVGPNVDRVFGFEDVRAAHEYLESNAAFGKVVLEF